MKKLSLIIVLFIFMFNSLSVFAEKKNGNKYSDWAKTEIIKARAFNIATEEILRNYTQDITRCEFCELIVNTYSALKREIPQEVQSPFIDVNNSKITAAYSLGIVNGISEKEFAPELKITREQMASMMGRMIKRFKIKEEKADLDLFEDLELVSDWATGDLETVVGTGIVLGLDNNKIAPDKNVTREQAIVMACRLYEYLGGNNKVASKDTSTQLLAELGIVDAENLNSSRYVTVYDAFVAMEKAMSCYPEETIDLKNWYIGDTLSALDYLDDSKKSMLLRLWYNGLNSILTYDEIANVQLDRPITNYEMLLYMLRMTGDTYGCTDDAIEYLSTKKADIYKLAYKKRLISSADTDNANSPVMYKDFSNVLHKALFVEFSLGGYITTSNFRLIDDLLNKKPTKNTYSERKEPEMVEIPVAGKVNSDLSVEWKLPENCSFIFEKGLWTEFGFITKDGEYNSEIMTGEVKTRIESTDMVKLLVRSGASELSALRCTYCKYGNDTEYYFDIDISNIKMVFGGKEIKPGKCIIYNNSYYIKELSLAETNFVKGCYYLLTDCDTTYRREEYNYFSVSCFKAEKTGKIYTPPADSNLNSSYKNEMHIQKVEVKMNSRGGYILSITPKSSKVFLKEESAENKI